MRDSSVPSSRSCTGQDILDRGRGPMQTVDQMDGWLELVQRALMRLCFIWKAISACLHHNRKGNKQSSSQRVTVTVLCFDPFYHIWPSNDTLSQQRKKSLKCVCVCERGPTCFRACQARASGVATQIHTKHPSRTGKWSQLMLMTSRRSGISRHRTLGSFLTSSTAHSLSFSVMVSPTNMADDERFSTLRRKQVHLAAALCLCWEDSCNTAGNQPRFFYGKSWWSKCSYFLYLNNIKN